MDLIEAMALTLMVVTVIAILRMLFVVERIQREDTQDYGNELSKGIERCAGINVHPHIEDEMKMAEAVKELNRGFIPINDAQVSLEKLFTPRYINRFAKALPKMHKMKMRGGEAYYSKEYADEYIYMLLLLKDRMIDKYGEITADTLIKSAKKLAENGHGVLSATYLFLLWAKTNNICNEGYTEFMKEIADKAQRNTFRAYERRYSNL